MQKKLRCYTMEPLVKTRDQRLPEMILVFAILLNLMEPKEPILLSFKHLSSIFKVQILKKVYP